MSQSSDAAAEPAADLTYRSVSKVNLVCRITVAAVEMLLLLAIVERMRWWRLVDVAGIRLMRCLGR